MRGPLYVVAQNVCLLILEALRVLKFGFAGGLDDCRPGRSRRSGCLAPLYIRQVDCPALCKSAPSRPAKPELSFQ
jgi:hypothetical protein